MKKRATSFEKRFPERTSDAARALAFNVRRLRQAKRLTQQAAAEELGIDQGDISRLENARANPTLQLLEALAEYFGTSVQQLFEPEP